MKLLAEKAVKYQEAKSLKKNTVFLLLFSCRNQIYVQQNLSFAWCN
jgi:hypothetical protein